MASNKNGWKLTNKKDVCRLCGRSGKCSYHTPPGSYDVDIICCHYTESPKQAGGSAFGGWLHFLKDARKERIGNDPKEYFAAKRRAAASTTTTMPTQGANALAIAPAPDAEPLYQLPITTTTPLTELTTDEISKAFEALLKCYPLQEKHKQYLTVEAGVRLDNDVAELLGTFKHADQARGVTAIVDALGGKVERTALHPAIKVQKDEKRGRQWLELAAWSDGLLIAARDGSGFIRGMQIRADNPKSKNSRYRWVSSDGKGGTPLLVLPGRGDAARIVLLTEGAKKALAARQQWGYTCISFQGVGTVHAETLLPELDRAQSVELILAFDMDKKQNKNVARAEQLLVNELKACRPELKITILNWNEKYKGLDDALLADHADNNQFKYQNAAARLCYYCDGKKHRLDKRVTFNLPLEALKQAYPEQSGPRLATTPEKIRQHSKGLITKLITLGKGNAAHICNANVTGTGKTTVTAESIKSAFEFGMFGTGDDAKRVLWLAPNKEAIRELTAPDQPLGQLLAENPYKVRVLLGRRVLDLAIPEQLAAATAAPTPYDCHNPLAEKAGANRHIAAVVACGNCPFGSLKNYQAQFGTEENPEPQPNWLCPTNGYLAAKNATKSAQIVIATKEAYLNNSSELDEFDLIVCDEELTDKLIELVHYDAGKIAEWKERLAQTTRFDLKAAKLIEDATERAERIEAVESFNANWSKFFKIVETALACLPERYAGNAAKNQHQQQSLLPVFGAIEEAARQLFGLSRAEFSELVSTLRDGGDQNYNFEHCYTLPDKTIKVPFRGAGDLLNALISQDAAMLKLHTVRNSDATYRIVLYRVRQNIVRILRTKQLLVLDATPAPALKKLFPKMSIEKLDARQPLEIWQVTSGLYSARDLANNDKTRAFAEKAVAGWAMTVEANNNLLAIVPKRLQKADAESDNTGFAAQGKELQLPVGTTIEHWGKHRALNKFTGCGGVVLSGHYLRPIYQIKAELDCIRAFVGETEEARRNGFYMADVWQDDDDSGFDDDNETETSQGYKLRIYNHNAGGRACGRWTRQLQDAELQTWLEYDYQANIMQAIGRLRAILLPDGSKPLPVLILSNDPVAGLPIDNLVSAGELTAVYEANATKAKQVQEAAATGESGSANLNDTNVTVEQGNVPTQNNNFPNNIKENDKKGGVGSSTNSGNDNLVSPPPAPVPIAPCKSEKYQFYYQLLTSQTSLDGLTAALKRIQGGFWQKGTVDETDNKALEELAKARIKEFRRAV